jgi:NlpC/P60 family/Bacterial dipeptidyl-peptidase Sh3 domain
MADKRVTPARPDLAAAHLRGKVEAARFVAGEKFSIIKGRASLRVLPSDAAAQDSELLFGESFTVYETRDGWAWGQAARDHYVGYVKADALGTAFTPELRVTALMTPLFIAPDVKKPLRDLLPLNSEIPVLSREGDYRAIAPDRFVHYRHLAPIDEHASDFVSVAERFAGVPYVWGGKTAAGLDCSGLIQTALAAAGISAPRDTDMMEIALGVSVGPEAIQRGDLVFWKGHMGVMLDARRLLHANAFHMEVFTEDLDQAVARIAKTAGPVTSIKRL